MIDPKEIRRLLDSVSPQHISKHNPNCDDTHGCVYLCQFEEVRQLLTLVRELVTLRPIETAPRDGTSFQVYPKDPGPYTAPVCLAFWDANEEDESELSEILDADDLQKPAGVWIVDGEWMDDDDFKSEARGWLPILPVLEVPR